MTGALITAAPFHEKQWQNCQHRAVQFIAAEFWKLFLFAFVYKVTNSERVLQVKRLFAVLLTVLLLCGCGARQLDLTAADKVQEVLALLEDGATMEPLESSMLLQGVPYGIYLNGDEVPQLQLYIYQTADGAVAEASCISDDGSHFQRSNEQGETESTIVEWVAAPHFFLYQNVIVQYIGTDENILAALQNLCGEQIAGTPFRQDTPSYIESEPWMSQPAPDAPEVLLEVLPDSVRSDGLTMNLVNNSNLVGNGVDVEYGEAFSLLQKMTAISCGVSKADANQSISETTVTWEPVPMDWFFDDLAYGLPAGAQAELQVALPDLAPGEYRITKNILYQQNGQSDYATFEVYADFVVPDEK